VWGENEEEIQAGIRSGSLPLLCNRNSEHEYPKDTRPARIPIRSEKAWLIAFPMNHETASAITVSRSPRKMSLTTVERMNSSGWGIDHPRFEAMAQRRKNRTMKKSTASHLPSTGCIRAARDNAMMRESISRRTPGTGSRTAINHHDGIAR
jgi:hypothetical protein